MRNDWVAIPAHDSALAPGAALDILTHALLSERNLDEEDIGLLLGPRPWVIR